MESTQSPATRDPFLSNVSRATLHVVLFLLLIAWCLQIVMPLIVPVLWGIVLAVSLQPLHAKFAGLLGGRVKLAAGLISFIAIALMLIPTGMFLGSLAEGANTLATSMRDGTLTVPPPPASVAEWPLIGEKTFALWTSAERDAAAMAQEFAPQITTLAGKLMGSVAGLGFGVLGFAFSLVLAGVFLAIGKNGTQLAEAIGARLLGPSGPGFVAIIVGTIRSVAQGVLGVAVIQALLIGVGLMFAGVPGAGLWTLLCLILGIAQLPPLLVTGPIIFYVFQGESSGTATIFAIWMVIASSSDMFLKPMFLGRGLDVPMPVILVGAIGGMMSLGILGLFLGAVVLAVFHRLFMAWVQGDVQGAEATEG